MLLFVILASSLFALSEQQGFVPLVAQNYNERVNSAIQQQVISYVSQELAYKYYASYYDRADVDLPGFKKFFTSRASEAAGQARDLTNLINQRGGRIRYPIVQLSEVCDLMEQELNLGTITRPVKSSFTTVPARNEAHICQFQRLTPKMSVEKKESLKSKYLNWFGTAKKNSKEETQEEETPVNREKWLQGLMGLEDALALERTVSSDVKKCLDLATTMRDPLTRHRLENFLAAQVDTVYKVAQLVERLQVHQNLDTYLLQEYMLDAELQKS